MTSIPSNSDATLSSSLFGKTISLSDGVCTSITTKNNYKFKALKTEGLIQRLFPSMLSGPLDKFPCALAKVLATLSVVLRTMDDSFYK